MITAALYVRISSSTQTLENQRAPLERIAAARGWAPRWYEETESAGKDRPVLERLMGDARRGELGAVLVVALDRLDRSMAGAVARVLELDRLGVQVVSVRESWLDTASPARPLLVAIFGWVAEQERAVLRERTRAGLERARAQGRRLGRPAASPLAVAQALELVAGGARVAAAARRAGLSSRTVRRALEKRGKNPPAEICPALPSSDAGDVGA